MKILVCAATGGETKIIKNNIKNLNIVGLSVSFFTTGIGNYETMFSLTNYLLSHKEEIPDLILNVGVCGYVGNKEKLVQVARIVNASTGKESIVPIPQLLAPVSSCFCSETPVFEKILNEENYVVDMESFAIDYVAQKFQIPRILIKVPVDQVGEETLAFDRDQALKLLEKNIDWKKIMEKVMK
ncbi:hypothetical protein P148_SR1C00001G0156 [candidate division SR1 bacterium RAAC1_SR1_1]|nr:hypothetical protein P148_SR1C00001G0156 [candidate division SR1 bacterium RAAC1_SR1_1]